MNKTLIIRLKQGGKVGRRGQLRLSHYALKRGVAFGRRRSASGMAKSKFEFPEILENNADTETDSTLRGWDSETQ